MVNNYGVIKEIKDYAELNNVPIMTNDGISYLTSYITKHQVKNVLEIGTAIGYSAIMMAMADKELQVTSIERDEKRYLEALKNIKKLDLEARINLIYKDAFDVKIDEQFDLIFIDAAKAQNTKFFEKFERNLKPTGTIITDNMNFHGLVEKDDKEIKSRNLRALVRKVRDYHEFLRTNKKYETDFLNIGDGLAISTLKK